jgi:hypothetical protein
MTTPGYNIRIGKAADRLLFREMLVRLASTLGLDEYHYIGLGGPFLEDFRLIHEVFPAMRLTSIEKAAQVWRRQRFHLPAKQIRTLNCDTNHYFANLHDESERVIVWLDFTDLRHSRLQEIWGLLPKLAPGSLLRVTLRAKGTDAIDHSSRKSWADSIFGRFEPNYLVEELDNTRFPEVLLRAIRRVTDDVSVQMTDASFQLLHAFVYDDGTQMLTFCGLIGDDLDRQNVKAALRQWQFKNVNWSRPLELSLPSLSLKERLFLEPFLPSRHGTGRELHNKLGYFIEDSEKRSVEALNQYRRLAEAYPRFARLAF